MKIFAEKEAEKFLIKEGFNVLEGVYVKDGGEILKLKNEEFPLVAKASGEGIIHKKKIGGIVLGIKNREDATTAFKKMKKVKGCEEVFFQPKAKGREFFAGLKKTPEFGYVVVFGKGGSAVEKEKDVSFRVCPLEKKDIIDMIKETHVGKVINSEEKKEVEGVLFKISRLSEKYHNISELDINPLMEGKIVDARIVWD